LFQTALFVKVIELLTRLAVPALSTVRPFRVVKKPPARLEVPLRTVWPVPLLVPLVQVDGPVAGTGPVPGRGAPGEGGCCTARLLFAVIVPPARARFWTLALPATVRLLKVATCTVPAPVAVAPAFRV